MSLAQTVCRFALAVAWGLLPLGIVRGAEAEPGAKAAAAQKLLWQGKYEEAIEAYQALAAGDADTAAIGLARAQAATGHADEAEQGLGKALAAAPKSARLAAELGQLQFDRGDYAAATKLVQQALEQDGNLPAARWLTAELARVAGDLPTADKGYKWLVDYYNAHDLQDPDSLHYVGLAAAQYARWNRISDQFGFLVNELYPEILQHAPAYWPAHLATGLLFQEKYNEADASKRAQGGAGAQLQCGRSARRAGCRGRAKL